jgi:hypothetical protein
MVELSILLLVAMLMAPSVSILSAKRNNTEAEYRGARADADTTTALQTNKTALTRRMRGFRQH